MKFFKRLIYILLYIPVYLWVVLTIFTLFYTGPHALIYWLITGNESYIIDDVFDTWDWIDNIQWLYDID